MHQGRSCPQCGAATHEWATWCQGCGYVFPVASGAGSWQVGRKPPEQPTAGSQQTAGAAAETARTTEWTAPEPAAAHVRDSLGWPTTDPARQTQPTPPQGSQPPGGPLPGAGERILIPPPWLPASRAWTSAHAQRRRRRNTEIAGAIMLALSVVVAVATVGALSGIGNSPSATPNPTRVQLVVGETPEPATPPATPPAARPATPPASGPGTATATPELPPTPRVRHVGDFIEFGEGMYAVGADIPPGTYRAPAATVACFWERTREVSAGVTDNVLPDVPVNGPHLVTIDASDARFSSVDCGTWTSDLAQITKSRTTFGDGVYIVGIDVEPGLYISPGGARCYWERLSGFGGTTDEVLPSEHRSSAPIVVVAATDAGFLSSGCGSWTRK